MYNTLVGLGMNPDEAGRIANQPDLKKANRQFQHAQAVYSQAQADYQANLANQRMAEAQQKLMAKIAQGPPRANKALRSSDYKPKFRSSISKVESKRATSRGTYQFSNPLGMGSSGGGSRTGGIGGLA